MARKRDPLDLATDRIVAALEKLPADRRLDALIFARKLLERTGALPKPERAKRTATPKGNGAETRAAVGMRPPPPVE